MMKEEVRELGGANMDIDLIQNKKMSWKCDKCPWNEAENTDKHKCAVKNISLCDYFRGIKVDKVKDRWDIVLCAYPK